MFLAVVLAVYVENRHVSVVVFLRLPHRSDRQVPLGVWVCSKV